MCLRTEGLMHWLRRYTPAKLTWKWNIHHLKMYFLLNMGIFQLFLVSSHRCDGNEPVLFAGQSHVRIRCSSESQRPEGGFGKMRDIRGFGKMNDLWSIVICDCMTSWCDDSGGCRIVGKRFMIWLVVSNIFYFHPYLGKWSNLTNIFQMGWNHQLVMLPSQKVWKTFQMLSLTNWFVTGKTMKWWDWSRKFQTFSTGIGLRNQETSLTSLPCWKMHQFCLKPCNFRKVMWDCKCLANFPQSCPNYRDRWIDSWDIWFMEFRVMFSRLWQLGSYYGARGSSFHFHCGFSSHFLFSPVPATCASSVESKELTRPQARGDLFPY